MVATVSRTAVVRIVVLRATVLYYYGKNYCVEGFSVGSCGVEGCKEVPCEESNDGVFRRIDRMLVLNDENMYLRDWKFRGRVTRYCDTGMLYVGGEVAGGKEDGEKLGG